MGTIHDHRRFRIAPSPANTPDGQTKLGGNPEKKSWENSDNEKSEKIRQMIAARRPGELGIVCLNAGQGDATIIRLPNGKIMVIDCNVDKSPENIVRYLKDAGIKKIDYLVITHPHQDHMSGTKDIADNFEVGEVWTTNYKRKRGSETPESYEAYQAYVKALDKLEKKGATIRTPTASNDPIVKDGKLEIRALGPSSYVQGNNEDIHEESLVIQVTDGKTSALFAGDTTCHQLDRICKYYTIEKTTLLHAPHHGSDKGANKDAMKQIRPDYTVISVGKENPHGHPHDDAMKTYRKTTEENVYRTDRGNIGFRFDPEGNCIEKLQ
jgi:competence protein ComEC